MIGRHRFLKAKRKPFGVRNTAEEAESWDEWMAAGGMQVLDHAPVSVQAVAA